MVIGELLGNPWFVPYPAVKCCSNTSTIQEHQLPKTLNSLMKHLRDSGIDINGSAQKRRLKNIGYYHGYKGYRFAGNAANRLPLTDFSQVAALYDFDTQLKALFYPRVMSIETALKNYTLEAVIKDARSGVFEDI